MHYVIRYEFHSSNTAQNDKTTKIKANRMDYCSVKLLPKAFIPKMFSISFGIQAIFRLPRKIVDLNWSVR